MKNTIRNKFILTLFITAVLLTNCTFQPTRIKKYNLKNLDLNTISNGIKNNYSDIKSINGRMTLSYATKLNSQRTTGSLQFIRPDSLYLELDGIAGETVLKLFLTPDSFFVENYYENLFIYDKTENFTMQRMTGININLNDLKPALFGYEEINHNFTVEEIKDNYIKIKTTDDPDGYRMIKLNNKLLIEEIVKYDKNEKKKYQKKFDYFFGTKEFTLPRRIIFKTYEPLQKLTIFYNDLEINNTSIKFSKKKQ